MFNLISNLLGNSDSAPTEGSTSLSGFSENAKQTLTPEQAEFARLLGAEEGQEQQYARDGQTPSTNNDGEATASLPMAAAPGFAPPKSNNKPSGQAEDVDKKQMLLNMMNPEGSNKSTKTAQDPILSSAEKVDEENNDKQLKTKEEIKERLKTLQASFQGSSLYQALSSPQQLSPDLLSENRFLKEASKVVSLNQYLDNPVPLKAFLPKLGLDETTMHEIMQSNDFKGATMAPSEIFAGLGLSPETVKEKILSLRATEDMTSKTTKDNQKPNDAVIAKQTELPKSESAPEKSSKAVNAKALERIANSDPYGQETSRTNLTSSRNSEPVPPSPGKQQFSRDEMPAETMVREFNSPYISRQMTPSTARESVPLIAATRPDLQARNLFDLQQSRRLERPVSESQVPVPTPVAERQPAVEGFPSQTISFNNNFGLSDQAPLKSGNTSVFVDTELHEPALATPLDHDVFQDRPEVDPEEKEKLQDSFDLRGPEVLHNKPAETHFSKEISANRGEASANNSNVEHVMKTIAEKSQVLVNDKGGQVNIQLNANDANSSGPVGLQIVVDNNKVDVKIASDDMDLKREMHAAIDALQANLGHKNLQLSDVKFTAHQDFSQQNQAGQQFFNQQNRQSFSWDQQLKDYVDSETGVPDLVVKKPLGKISPYQVGADRYKIGLDHPQGNIQLLA